MQLLAWMALSTVIESPGRIEGNGSREVSPQMKRHYLWLSSRGLLSFQKQVLCFRITNQNFVIPRLDPMCWTGGIQHYPKDTLDPAVKPRDDSA